MFQPFQRGCVASATALALSSLLLTVPSAFAKENTTETSEVNLNLACNLQGNLKRSRRENSTGVYNSGVERFSAYNLQIEATAPTTVEPNAEFDYTIVPKLSFPSNLHDAKQDGTEVLSVSQMNLWIDLPQNASIQEDGVVVTNDDQGLFEVSVDDGRLHIKGKSGANVKEWTGTDQASWTPGGLESTTANSEDRFAVPTPTITLKMRAPSEADSEIRPSINSENAYDFSPSLFYQLLLQTDYNKDGHAVPAFVRCGLSENNRLLWTDTKKSERFPAVAVKSAKKTSEIHGQIQLTDPSGNPLAEGTEVKLLIGDPGQEIPFTVGDSSLFEVTKELTTDQSAEFKVAFADNPDGAVTLTLEGNQGDTVSKAVLQQKAYPQPIRIRVIDAQGNSLAENSTVSLVVDGQDANDYTVDAQGFVTVNAVLAIGQEKTVDVYLAGHADTKVSVTLVGAKDAEAKETAETLQQPEKQETVETYAVTAKIKVTDAEDKPLSSGTKVSLAIDNEAPSEYAVDDDGYITISTELKDGEEKTVKVVLVDTDGRKSKPVSVTLNCGKNTEPVVAKDTLKMGKKDNGDSKPDEQTSSMSEGFDLGAVMDPKLWGTIVASLLTAQALFFILQVAGGFINGLIQRFTHK